MFILTQVLFMLSAVTATIISRKSKAYFPVARLLVANSKSFFSFGRAMATLESLNFDNRALRSLPVDRDEEIYSRSVAGRYRRSRLGVCDVFVAF